MIQINVPRSRHIKDLVQLSHSFAGESSWASSIPIGQIDTEESANLKLFGADVIVALTAETDTGEMVGYVGIYRHQDGAYLSILVAEPYRGMGLGKRLVEDAFGYLPEGMVVEAWVGAFNGPSLVAMPRMGFELDRVIEDDGREVHVFIRKA